MKNLTIILIAALITGCLDPENNDSTPEAHKSPGKAVGDKKAIELARRVIDASGGEENFNKIPYLSFDYFGRRYWFWDKFNSRYRLESESRNLRAAGKLDGSETHLWLGGNPVTDIDSISKYKDFAYRAWINDTYWLLFPFKLLDEGVQLRYLGECIADSTTKATCIELTFNNVGVTPENKYIAYIDTNKNEVIHWDYFKNKNDTLPSVSNPWNDYRTYGAIRISGGRGGDTIEEIRIHNELPNEIFTDVTKSSWQILK